MALSRTAAAFLAFALTAVPPLGAQAGRPVTGKVLSATDGTPLQGALVRSRRAARATVSDRLGGFALLIRDPDTLTVTLIGFQPVTIALDGRPTSIVVVLRSTPLSLPDLVASAPAPDGALLGLGRWRIGQASLQTVPFALEPDLLRVLAITPSVSFSSPLSGRPIVRGYDPSESSIRIDGFEVFNPYHLARSFFVFPPDAAESVTLSPGPHPANVGGTLSGLIDVSGRAGVDDTANVGISASFGGLSAWTGGGGETTWFAGGRAATLALTNLLIPGTLFPYSFGDLYATVGRPARFRVSAFATRDHLGQRSGGSGGDWGTVLLGSRWSPLAPGPNRLTLIASATRSTLDIDGLTVRSSTLTARNRLGKVEGGVVYLFRSGIAQFETGVTLAHRTVDNRVVPVGGTDFPARDVRTAGLETAFHVSAGFTTQRVAATAGLRIDRARGITLVQPRAELGLRLSSALSASLALGRSGRHFHFISNLITEPELDFAEFWLAAGEDGVPAPRVDHVTLDLRYAGEVARFRVGVFGSRGTGVGELRDVGTRTPAESPFRFGSSRTIGLEGHVAVSAHHTPVTSLALAYVLSGSRRNFGDGWHPWGLERRHLVRLNGQLQLSARTVLSAAAELASGLPFTPVAAVVYRHGVGSPLGFPSYLRGEENSGRGGGTFRLDIAIRHRVSGLLGGRGWLGLSLTNLTFGEVAPQSPDVILAPVVPRVPYKRLYKLPAIPSVFLELRF